MTLLAVLSAPVAAVAQETGPRAFDTIFRTGTLDGLPVGTELHYDGVGMPPGASGDGWTSVVVGLGPESRVEVKAADGTAATRVVGTFDAGIGNPLAMIFLEATVNAVAGGTGGNPVYIRNRIRDALAGSGDVEATSATWQGANVEAVEVALRPFEDDARRAELGAFAELEIRVIVSEAVPGWYLSIGADAPATATAPGYDASLSLAEAEE